MTVCPPRDAQVAHRTGRTLPPALWQHFPDFEEADRLLAAVDDEWRTMVLVALRTGMRMGELIALRWQDVDLLAGKVTVKQNAVKGRLGTPKLRVTRDLDRRNRGIVIAENGGS
jgi:integrase